jgi:radical SAM superfamily enzyme YgiQ (UPF0313 family)
MKIGLIAFNWQFDTSLALWNIELYAKLNEAINERVSFAQYCGKIPGSFGEEEIITFALCDWIKEGDFDIIGFSCYVWNIDFINKIAKMVKSLMPNITIVYGGQQIRGLYIRELLEKEKCADILIEGEGEITFRDLILSRLVGVPALDSIGGLHYVENGAIKSTGGPRFVKNLDEIPSPYTGEISLPANGSFLLEASRGCPYTCGYCLWAEPSGVREYPIERVEKELAYILDQKPKHIMFCDGTFNKNKNRAKRILKVMCEHLRAKKIGPFSCLVENRLELIDEETALILDELITLNPLFTVEFGLQSANKISSELSRRKFDEDKFLKSWNTLTPKVRNSAELDCIYGLPGEEVEDFKSTVDFAYSLSPLLIQCFPLCVLPGTHFEHMAEEYGIKYHKEPNHAVYATNWVTAKEVQWLKAFGYAVSDLYHTHGTTIASILGLRGRFTSFSQLIAGFVNRTGASTIFSCLRGIREPSLRGRYIDLSGLFTEYVAEILDNNNEVSKRIADLLKYEALLGAMANEEPAALTSQEALSSHEHLVSNAMLFKSSYNVEYYVKSNKYEPNIDILTMQEKDTLIALPQNTNHPWIKFIPGTMKIDDLHIKVLSVFQGGREKTEGISMLGREGYSLEELNPIFRGLFQHGLLLLRNAEA